MQNTKTTFTVCTEIVDIFGTATRETPSLPRHPTPPQVSGVCPFVKEHDV